MSPLHKQTPLIYSNPLSSLLNKPVHLKIESMQASGSFKDRGAGRLCAEYAEQGAKRFVTSSGGNAGMAIAYMGKRLGVPVEVITPRSTQAFMREKIVALGAQVHVHGASWDEADILARERSLSEGAFYVPSFDHPLIWEGISSIVDEVAEQGIRPGGWVLSIGGGGLLCGVLKGLEKQGWEDTPVVAVETEGASSLSQSIRAKQLLTLDAIDTVAITLGARRVAAQALDYALSRPVYSQTVTDQQAIRAVLNVADDHRILVEPACGASLSVAYEQLPILDTMDSLVIVCCGGNGVSRALLSQWEAEFCPNLAAS